MLLSGNYPLGNKLSYSLALDSSHLDLEEVRSKPLSLAVDYSPQRIYVFGLAST